MNIDGIFYSYDMDEIPRLRGVKELLLADSVAPSDLDPAVLPIGDETHIRRRSKLDEIPELWPTLQEEYEIYRDKLAEKERHLPGQPYVVRGTYVRRLDSKERLRDLRRAVKAAFNQRCTLTGDFIYYPGSYREWHTNIFNDSGWRMYLVDVAEERRSGFRYVSPTTGKMTDVLDRRGRANFFRIDKYRPLIHGVYSHTLRWSKGFVIPDDWQKVLFE